MNRTSNLLTDELPESEQCLADVLKRFALKEKQRRARHIVQRRAKQLNEVREDVLRRRAEKGQPMDILEEQAQAVGINGREEWECKNDGLMVAAIAMGIGRKSATVNKKEIKGKVKATQHRHSGNHKDIRKSATYAVKELRGKINRRRALKECSLRIRGQGMSAIPRDFSPLADIPEVDLGRVYAEPNYETRFRMYKEAARKACGLKVWTWEELTDGISRTLHETCRMPPSHIEIKRATDRAANSLDQTIGDIKGNAATCLVTNPKTSRSRLTSVSRHKYKVPECISRDVVRSIKQEIQDEKREQKLKFLELEMKMTPYVVDAGLFDSDPEFTEELNESIAQAQAKQILFDAMKNPRPRNKSKARHATSYGTAITKRHSQITAYWNHIPTATAKRAVEREQSIARRREKKASLDYDPYEDDGLFRGLNSMLSYDPSTREFSAPQATLLRAQEREQEMTNRARWREQVRERRRKKKERRAKAKSEGANPSNKRGPRRDKGSKTANQETNSEISLQQKHNNMVCPSSGDESGVALPIRGIVKSRASGGSSTPSFRKPGYYLGDNMSSSSSSFSLASTGRGDSFRSPSVASLASTHFSELATPRNCKAIDEESCPRTDDGRDLASPATKIVAGDTCPQEDTTTGPELTPRQWSNYKSSLDNDYLLELPDWNEDFTGRATSPCSWSERSNDSRKTTELLAVEEKQSTELLPTTSSTESIKITPSTSTASLSQVPHLSTVKWK